MADGSWDNGGHGVPLKPGLPLWAKVTMGCGIALLVVLVTCVSGLAWVANKAKRDPEGLKHWVMDRATEKVRPDWDDFTGVVEQLRTAEGSHALYTGNPDLAQSWPKEADFLKEAESWRKSLPAVPPLGPELMEQHGISISYQLGGPVRMDWHPKDGSHITVVFASKRKPGDYGPRKVTSVEVR